LRIVGSRSTAGFFFEARATVEYATDAGYIVTAAAQSAPAARTARATWVTDLLLRRLVPVDSDFAATDCKHARDRA
jgi:hypothetical protein